MPQSVKLNGQDRTNAALRLEAAAQIHCRTAGICGREALTKRPRFDAFALSVVSLEMYVLSAEQSLKLFLLFNDSILRQTHDLHYLYNKLQQQNPNGVVLCNRLLIQSRGVAQKSGFDDFSESDLQKLLEKHRSAYEVVRYFGLSRQGTHDQRLDIPVRDREIIGSFSNASAALCTNKLLEHDIEPVGWARR